MTLTDVQTRPIEVLTAQVWPRRKQFTSAECQHMLQTGILKEDDRLELVEGELVQMSPISSRHAGVVNRLSDFLRRQSKGQAIVSVQNPIHLEEYSEPQPDLVLLKPRPDYYTKSHPTSAEVLLVVEVAETSASYDRELKMPLYARAGIAEAWLVSLPDKWIEVYTEPTPAGYLSMRKSLPGSTLAPQAFPDTPLAVSDIVE